MITDQLRLLLSNRTNPGVIGADTVGLVVDRGEAEIGRLKSEIGNRKAEVGWRKSEVGRRREK